MDPAQAVYNDGVTNLEGFTNCRYSQPIKEAEFVSARITAKFRDYGKRYSVDVPTKKDSNVSVDKVLTVDGEPARLIVSGHPSSSVAQDYMRIIFGKGTRGYELTLTYPYSQRQQYMELAMAVCKSIRIRTVNDEMKEGADLPKASEILARIPEFADSRIGMSEDHLIEVVVRSRIGMSEEQFRQVLARRDVELQSTRAKDDNTSSYTLTAINGRTMIVRFSDGKCSGIQAVGKSLEDRKTTTADLPSDEQPQQPAAQQDDNPNQNTQVQGISGLSGPVSITKAPNGGLSLTGDPNDVAIIKQEIARMQRLSLTGDPNDVAIIKQDCSHATRSKDRFIRSRPSRSSRAPRTRWPRVITKTRDSGLLLTGDPNDVAIIKQEIARMQREAKTDLPQAGLKEVQGIPGLDGPVSITKTANGGGLSLVGDPDDVAIVKQEITRMQRKAKADLPATSPSEVSARLTVTLFLNQLAKGQMKSDGKRANWAHVNHFIVREKGWSELAGLNKWSDELVKLAGNEAFRPIASLGTADRMMVLACTTRKKPVADDSPKIALFDLVKQNNHWLIEQMQVHQNEEAWATVNGFARNDSVRWEVTYNDIIGDFYVGFLNCRGPETFAQDGTWKARLGGATEKTGTWRLEGDVLVCADAKKIIKRSRIVKFTNGGFVVEDVTTRDDGASNEENGDKSLNLFTKQKWQTTFSRTANFFPQEKELKETRDGKKTDGGGTPLSDQINSGSKSVGKNESYQMTNQDGSAKREVTDVQTVDSAIAYRKLETKFNSDNSASTIDDDARAKFLGNRTYCSIF